RRSVSAAAYVIRFTPRKPTSIWSNVNIRKAEALFACGRMRPAGLHAFEARDAKKSGIYAFEQRKKARLAPREEKQFRANKAAWKFFEAQPPGYRQITAWWIISAKRPETRARRLAMLIDDSEAGRRIRQLRPTPRSK
ncbi:MAG TPA: YdeI/OmpD-associated family protein, partial [Gemmatimonadaceae bacterium]|nr:YdeI/OmpD-associated family protein [Gemmatimonadaceae bacterium]